MKEALEIFMVGLGGVFLGMGLLYVAVRLISLVADRIGAGKES